jgi:hypothetical protein
MRVYFLTELLEKAFSYLFIDFSASHCLMVEECVDATEE